MYVGRDSLHLQKCFKTALKHTVTYSPASRPVIVTKSFINQRASRSVTQWISSVSYLFSESVIEPVSHSLSDSIIQPASHWSTAIFRTRCDAVSFQAGTRNFPPEIFGGTSDNCRSHALLRNNLVLSQFLCYVAARTEATTSYEDNQTIGSYSEIRSAWVAALVFSCSAQANY